MLEGGAFFHQRRGLSTNFEIFWKYCVTPVIQTYYERITPVTQNFRTFHYVFISSFGMILFDKAKKMMILYMVGLEIVEKKGGVRKNE